MMAIGLDEKAAVKDGGPQGAGAKAADASTMWGELGAMWWKDLRECGGLVLGAWVLVGMVVGWNWVWVSQGWGRSPVHAFYLLDSALMAFFPILTALFGIILGLLMHRSQGAFDAWAFLVHRPMTRSRWFGYRVANGMMLYAAGVGVPMAVFVVWAVMNPVATPLFHWRMLLPYVADYLLGVVAWFGAVVAVQRQARWYGTKLLPLVAVVGVGIVVVNAREFWEAAVVECVVLVALVVVAWGETLTHGEDEEGPWVSRVGLRGVLLAGLGLLGVVAVTSGAEWIRGYKAPERPREMKQTIAVPEMLEDGEMVIKVIEEEVSENGTMTQRSAEMFTLGGERVPWKKPLEVMGLGVFGSEGSGPTGETYRHRGSIVQQTEMVSPGLPAGWMYFRHEKTVVNFWGDGRTFETALGPGGIRRDGKAEAFDPVGADPLVSKHAVYYGVDLAKGTIETIAFPGETVREMKETVTADGTFWAIATDKAVHVYQTRPVRELVALALPTQVRESGFWVGKAEGKGYRITAYSRSGAKMLCLFYDMAGKLLKSTELGMDNPVLAKYGQTGDRYERNPGLARKEFEGGAIMSLGMPAALGMVAVHVQGSPRWGEMVGHPALVWEALVDGRYTLLGVVVVNVLAAVLAVWIGRRHGMGWWRTGVWVRVVGVLGPLSLLALFGTYRMPVRVRCAGCGGRRSVERERCGRCGAGVARPGLNGTEIFEGG